MVVVTVTLWSGIQGEDNSRRALVAVEKLLEAAVAARLLEVVVTEKLREVAVAEKLREVVVDKKHLDRQKPADSSILELEDS